MNHATRFARLVLLLALVGALALAGCGGSDSGSPTMPMTETPPTTPYEMAVTNIAAADTADAAQAAYDAVKDDVTAAEGDKLQAAVDMAGSRRWRDDGPGGRTENGADDGRRQCRHVRPDDGGRHRPPPTRPSTPSRWRWPPR